MLTLKEMQAIVALCEFESPFPYSFTVTESRGSIYLQATYLDEDIITHVQAMQYTRKWLLSPYMTKSEVVQTVFKCCITSMEHRCREGFKYKGKRIFGPHYNVDALHAIVGSIDVRKEGH